MNNINIKKAKKEYFTPQILIIRIDSLISLNLDSKISSPGDDPIIANQGMLYNNKDANPFSGIV